MTDDHSDPLTQHMALNRAGKASAADVLGGVSVSFLMGVFRMDRQDINRRLKDCPVMGGVRHKDSHRHLYDLATASQYLVKPVFDAEEYIKTMRVSELPATLQDSFWSAMGKRQKWEENAGQLWRTEDVMASYGEVFKLIKSTMQLWAENMQRSEGLKPEQKTFLRAQVDGLQKLIHDKIGSFDTQTRPQIDELESILDREKPVHKYDDSLPELPSGANDDLI